jgi:hypothetical protein
VRAGGGVVVAVAVEEDQMVVVASNIWMRVGDEHVVDGGGAEVTAGILGGTPCKSVVHQNREYASFSLCLTIVRARGEKGADEGVVLPILIN